MTVLCIFAMQVTLHFKIAGWHPTLHFAYWMGSGLQMWESLYSYTLKETAGICNNHSNCNRFPIISILTGFFSWVFSASGVSVGIQKLGSSLSRPSATLERLFDVLGSSLALAPATAEAAAGDNKNIHSSKSKIIVFWLKTAWIQYKRLHLRA